jgi:hypothetical protein
MRNPNNYLESFGNLAIRKNPASAESIEKLLSDLVSVLDRSVSFAMQSQPWDVLKSIYAYYGAGEGKILESSFWQVLSLPFQKARRGFWLLLVFGAKLKAKIWKNPIR